MKPRENVHIRQMDPFYTGSPGLYGQGELPYPGLGTPFAGGASPWPAAYQPQQLPIAGGGLGSSLGTGLGAGAAGGAGAAAGGSGSGLNLNLGQIKGFIDKMGGIDGIVGTMTRVQKMVSSFQQMAPMLKLLMGSFGGAKASANSFKNHDGLGSTRRKRRRKKGKQQVKKYRSGGPGKTWTSTRSKKRR